VNLIRANLRLVARRRHSLRRILGLTGKPEAFRTSGGKAAPMNTRLSLTALSEYGHFFLVAAAFLAERERDAAERLAAALCA
jgi:hypothetical protein